MDISAGGLWVFGHRSILKSVGGLRDMVIMNNIDKSSPHHTLPYVQNISSALVKYSPIISS